MLPDPGESADMPNRRFTLALIILSAIAAIILNSCSEDCEVCPELPRTEDITIAAAEYGEYCPTYFSGGDYDFDGNGPTVYLEAEAYVSGDSLLFYFSVDAIETQSDWTRAAGRWDVLLYQAPDGWVFSAIDTPVACSRYYIDINHEMDFIDCGDVKFRGYGDSSGDDIGTGCVKCMYWVWIREINIEITRE